jgi:CcdB protein
VEERRRVSAQGRVILQSPRYDYCRRRVVVPLVNKSSLGKITNPRFNPTFRIKDQSVVLHPLDIVSVATENLGLNRPAATHARPRRRDLAYIAAEPDAEHVLRASGIILTSSM